jgi:hypothetical protein
MLTMHIAFPIGTFETDDDALTYGAMVFRTMCETVGKPSALLSGYAEWVTGEQVPVATAVTYDPDLSRVDAMVEALTVLAALYGQPVVAASLANVELIGPDAASYVYLSSPGLPSEAEAARYPDADLDAWRDTDADLDALARELEAFYDDGWTVEDDEHGVFVVTLDGRDDAADEPQPESD